MGFECSSTTILPIFMGLWSTLFELTFPYIALQPGLMKRWTSSNPNERILPWIVISVCISSIFKVAGTAITVYSACEDNDNTDLVNIFFGLLVVFEYVTLVLWIRPSSPNKPSPALAGVSAYLIAGILFTANLFQYGDFLEGSLVLISVLLKIPQFYMYSKVSGPVPI